MSMYQKMKHARLSRAFKNSILATCSTVGNASFLDVVVMNLMGGEL